MNSPDSTRVFEKGREVESRSKIQRADQNTHCPQNTSLSSSSYPVSFESDIWRDFFKNYWLKKPRVIKNLDFSIADLHQCENGISELLKVSTAANEIHTPRLYIDGGKVDFYNSRRFLNSNDFEEKFSLIINNFQSLDSDIFENSSRFLKNLYKFTGFPEGGALLDLFWSNHTTSILDLHKDEQEVFTFVIQGEKTFYTWPFEYFQEKLGLASHLKSKTQALDGFNFKAYVNDAQILTARPGDLIYWPASYWHIAVSDVNEPVLTLGLGLFMNPVQPFYFHSKAARYLYDHGLFESLPFNAQELQKSANFHKRLWIEKEKYYSAAGFKSAPKPKLVNSAFKDYSKFVLNTSLATRLKNYEDETHLFHGGQHFNFNNTQAIYSALSSLVTEGELRLQKFLECFNAEESNEIKRVLFSLTAAGVIKRI